MNDLDATQALLVRAFQRKDPVADDPAIAAACREKVAGNERVPPDEQVDIYRRQFWLRHRDALLEDYPGLAFLLGESGFDAFVRGYLDAHPPVRPSLRDLGEHIVGFAERWDGFGDRKAIAIAMARYENSFVDLFDGAEPTALDAGALAAIDPAAWDTARIVLSPLLRLARFDYPVHTLRAEASARITKDGETEEPAAAPAPREVLLAYYRGDDMTIHYEELPEPAFLLLEALGRGEPLPAACARAATAGDDVMAKVGGWFQSWTARRWIVGIELREEGGPSALTSET